MAFFLLGHFVSFYFLKNIYLKVYKNRKAVLKTMKKNCLSFKFYFVLIFPTALNGHKAVEGLGPLRN